MARELLDFIGRASPQQVPQMEAFLAGECLRATPSEFHFLIASRFPAWSQCRGRARPLLIQAVARRTPEFKRLPSGCQVLAGLLRFPQSTDSHLGVARSKSANKHNSNPCSAA